MRGGISVDSLGISQMAICLTEELNHIDKLDEYWDIAIFYHKFDKQISTPYFAMFQEEELWGYGGPVIATNLGTAERVIKSPRICKKYFYLWDLEWINNQYDVDYLSSIYCNEDIQLIARNQDHYNTIKACWREPAYILEEFNYEQLANIFRNTQP